MAEYFTKHKSHSKFILKNFLLKVNGKSQCLTSIFWIPKLCNNPNNARFIIVAPKCFLKPLPKSVMSAFKLVFGITKLFWYKDLSNSI